MTGNKEFYDWKAHSMVLQPGDRVLVRNPSQRGGPEKLRSDCEEQMHITEKRKADSLVYRMRPEGGRGKQESTTP